MQLADNKAVIEKAWDDRGMMNQEDTRNQIREVIEWLDKGKVRVAEPSGNSWMVNEWIKKAVILYFPIQQMETIYAGPFEYHDKIGLKRGFQELGVRLSPMPLPAMARILLPA